MLECTVGAHFIRLRVYVYQNIYIKGQRELAPLHGGKHISESSIFWWCENSSNYWKKYAYFNVINYVVIICCYKHFVSICLVTICFIFHGFVRRNVYDNSPPDFNSLANVNEFSVQSATNVNKRLTSLIYCSLWLGVQCILLSLCTNYRRRSNDRTLEL